MSKIKDTDFLFISTWIRASEQRSLTRERMERMLDARSNEEAVKVLSECGYADPEDNTAEALDRVLAAQRAEAFDEIRKYAPIPEIVDVFRLKYDYHNVKTLIKSEAMGVPGERLLMDAGRVEASKLVEMFRQSDFRELPQTLRAVLEQARETIASTSNPQLVDMMLDRAYYQETLEIAEKIESDFLTAYIKLMIDAANLRSTVRVLRMKKDAEFLKQALIDGGNVDIQAFVNAAYNTGEIVPLFSSSRLQAAAEAGQQAINGGRLTEFERLCDDALMEFLKQSKFTPFGEPVLVSYLGAKEAEITAVRIIMTGRMAGLSADSIRERLREAYV